MEEEILADSSDEKGEAGRPRIEFDLEQIKAFGSIGATMREIAQVLGCSERTIERRMGEEDPDHDPEFRAAYELGYGDRKMSLRRKQTGLALEGNPTMLIWLGKQDLGQKDRNELSGPGDTPLVPPQINVGFVKPTPSEPKE